MVIKICLEKMEIYAFVKLSMQPMTFFKKWSTSLMDTTLPFFLPWKGNLNELTESKYIFYVKIDYSFCNSEVIFFNCGRLYQKNEKTINGIEFKSFQLYVPRKRRFCRNRHLIGSLQQRTKFSFWEKREQSQVSTS